MLEQFGGLVEKIKKVQQNVDELNERLASEEIEVTNGDVMKIIINGQQEVLSIELNTKYLDPTHAILLQSSLIDTINKALTKSRTVHQAAMEQLATDLNLPKIPGLF